MPFKYVDVPFPDKGCICQGFPEKQNKLKIYVNVDIDVDVETDIQKETYQGS